MAKGRGGWGGGHDCPSLAQFRNLFSSQGGRSDNSRFEGRLGSWMTVKVFVYYIPFRYSDAWTNRNEHLRVVTVLLYGYLCI